MNTDLRCDHCGCALSPGGSLCLACGTARPASPAAAGASDYPLAPLPTGPYEVELGVSESLAWTFRLWAENLPRTALLAFVPYLFMLPILAFGIAMLLVPDQATRAGEALGATWVWGTAAAVALGLLWFVATLASAAAIIHVVDEKVRGAVVGPFNAFLVGLRHTGWFFLGSLVMSGLALLAVAGPLVPAVAAIAKNDPMIALLSIPGLAGTAVATVLGARLAPTLPAIVIEDLDVAAAVSRAWRLTRGHTGTLVGAVLLFVMAWTGASMIGAMVGIVPILGVIAQMVVNALLMPLAYIFPFAIYAGAVRAEQNAQR